MSGGVLLRRSLRYISFDQAAALASIAGSGIVDRMSRTAWTDFSAADDPSADGPNNNTKVDRFGGSISLALRGEHTETSLNLYGTYASGHTLIPSNLDFTTLKKTSEKQTGFFAVVASLFQF